MTGPSTVPRRDPLLRPLAVGGLAARPAALHGAHGRPHDAGVPAQRAPLGRRPRVHRDDLGLRRALRQPAHARLLRPRRGRAPARLPAVRRRRRRAGGRGGQGGGGRRRPGRPQHGLPGAQGRQDGRRRGAARGAGPRRRHRRRRRRGRGGRRAGARRPGHGQDPRGAAGRRRARAPGGAPARRRRRSRRLHPPAHGGAAVPRPRRPRGDVRARRRAARPRHRLRRRGRPGGGARGCSTAAPRR